MMLNNIKPNRQRSKNGSLTLEEKQYCKALHEKGYVVQDIVYIVNQGRSSTVNQSVVHGCISKNDINCASDDDLNKYLAIQSSYDPVTLLNPYIDERLIRARESYIAAVQIYNNPLIKFKTEIFCVLSNIAWTYLLHEKIERNQEGASRLSDGKSITVSEILKRDKLCPLDDGAIIENLRKIIDIRNEVEHTFFKDIDKCFSMLFQANCINFENCLISWFGEHLSLTNHLPLALQFVGLDKDQIIDMESANLPPQIRAIYENIQSNKYANNNAFQFAVYYTSENTSKTNAEIHKLITYSENDAAREVVIKKQNFSKLSATQIVEKARVAGYKKFTNYEHQKFWQSRWKNADLRNEEAKEYGELILKTQWVWYEQKWLAEVLTYCKEKGCF